MPMKIAPKVDHTAGPCVGDWLTVVEAEIIVFRVFLTPRGCHGPWFGPTSVALDIIIMGVSSRLAFPLA